MFSSLTQSQAWIGIQLSPLSLNDQRNWTLPFPTMGFDTMFVGEVVVAIYASEP